MINCGRKIHINDVEYNWTRRKQNLPKYPPPLIIMLILDFGIENRNVCPTVPYPLWVFYVIIYGPYRWSLIILPFAASCASLFLAPTATVDWKYDPEMGKETKMSFQKEEQLRFTTRRSFSQLDLNNCIPTGSLCWPIVREDTFWFVQVTAYFPHLNTFLVALPLTYSNWNDDDDDHFVDDITRQWQLMIAQQTNPTERRRREICLNNYVLWVLI